MITRHQSEKAKGNPASQSCRAVSGQTAEDSFAPHSISFSQRSIGNIATLRLSDYPGPVQPKLRQAPSNDPYETEADRMAQHAVTGRGAKPKLSAVQPEIQRRSAADTASATLAPTEISQPTTAEPAESTTEDTAAMPGLIVDDREPEPAAGQMRRSEFLAQLRVAVCNSAEAALAGTIWSAAGCPWIDHWFGYYSNRDSHSIERAIRRYTPEAKGAATAADYIPLISARVQRAIAAWSSTGKVSGVPDDLAQIASRAGSGMPESPAAKTGSRPSLGADSQVAGGGSVLLKSRSSENRQPQDSHNVQTRLGSGQPLDSGVKSRFERAFGQDFSKVRVHTDAGAAKYSDQFDARAFTIGEHVAFGSGEYRPGTLIGDALIAHELAHVVQQGSRPADGVALQAETPAGDALEEDADRSAVGAVAQLWGSAIGRGTDGARGAWPRLRSTLKLQRCSKSKAPPGTCPTDVVIGRVIPMEFNEANVRQGWRTGFGAVAEMQVSHPSDYDFDGTPVHENLSARSSTCTNMPNCSNISGGGGSAGSTWSVGDPSSGYGISLPGKQNIFYDWHMVGLTYSYLHREGLQSCEENCSQYFDCGGTRIGSRTFTIRRNYRRQSIAGHDVSVITLTKT